MVNRTMRAAVAALALLGLWLGTATAQDNPGGGLLRTFEGHSGSVNSVAFSPDGRTVLLGSLSGRDYYYFPPRG